MRRRKFIALLVSAAAWPLAARGQQAGKLPTVGMLGSSLAAFSYWLPALLQRLRELGWIENRTMAIEYRWTEGRNERYGELAGELVRLKVDVIVAARGAGAAAGNASDRVPQYCVPAV